MPTSVHDDTKLIRYSICHSDQLRGSGKYGIALVHSISVPISVTGMLQGHFTQSPLLPPCNPANYRFNLRPRGHNLSLPYIKKALSKTASLRKFSISVNSPFIIEYARC